MDNTQHPGDLVRANRLAAGLKLEDLAEELQCSPQFVSMVERGLRRPSFDNLATWVQVTNVPAKSFYPSLEAITS